MSPLALSSRLSGLTPIGLPDLVDRAALQTRVDRKYIVPGGEVESLLSGLGAGTEVLEIDGVRTFTYETIYFDTPDLLSYLLTARRRRRRFKIRTRVYLDSALCVLEVKVPGSRGRTVKHRTPYRYADQTTLAPGRQFVDGVLARQAIVIGPEAPFLPTLATRYQRSTLFLPETASRVTIDTDLSWYDDHRRLSLSELAVVETKTSSTPSGIDRQLWRRGHRPVRVSKYCTGLAALRQDLPAWRWQRVLRRYFNRADRAECSRSPLAGGATI